jgi:hypothetical protein
MKRGKNQHILLTDNGWGVKAEGNTKFTRVTDSLDEATKIARALARPYNGEVIIHCHRQGLA